MIKTIIFRLENVVLNLDILQFKILEMLWYYLRRDSRWNSFESVLKLREADIRQRGTEFHYPHLSYKYLPEREGSRFVREAQIFIAKMGNFYLRTVPEMITRARTLKYTYKIILLAEQSVPAVKAVGKFNLERYFNFILWHPPGNSRPDHVKLLQQALHLSRAEADEAILVSDRLPDDLSAAAHIPMLTVGIRFDPLIRGFLPQNNRERLFVQSLLRVPEQPEPDRFSDLLAESPREVSEAIAKLENEEISLTGSHPPASPETNFWDLARKMLLPPDES